MKIKRILMLGPVDFSIDNAPKVHFSNLAKEFAELGFDVLCVVYAPEKGIVDTVEDKFRVSFPPNPLSGNLFLRALKYLCLLPITLWHFFKFAPNIIYFRFSPPAFLYIMVLKSLKIFTSNFKIVLEFNDWVSEEREIQGEGLFKVKLIDFLQTKSASLSDCIRVVAEGLKYRLVGYGIKEDKISVIENGTDINHFKPIDRIKAKENFGFDPDLLFVGFLGNFAIWQGLDHLLLAIPEVWKTFPEVRFLLIGDGPKMPAIRKAVSKFEKEKVILTGRIPYQEANLYINSFDIAVAPFIKKSNDVMLSPMKIRDYAACGIPFVTTKIRGLEMVEEKGIGILVPPDNPAALSEAIIKLIRDPVLRKKMGRKGRKVAEEEFSWKDVAGNILEKIGN
jgi:glycosyltransferase involved in cell wall biosynthesis